MCKKKKKKGKENLNFQAVVRQGLTCALFDGAALWLQAGMQLKHVFPRCKNTKGDR